MNIVKQIASEQNRRLVNKTAIQLRQVQTPKIGWLSTIRKALGMSAAQLARRMNVTRALISRTEKGELSGSVTLKTMQAIAESMGCRFVYAIVPENTVEDILAERANIKAARVVNRAGIHASLEDQALTKNQMTHEIERLKNQLLKDMPPDFWTDKE